MLALACLAVACQRTSIDLSLVVTPRDAARTTPLDGIIGPKFTQCSSCEPVEFVNGAGWSYSVLAEKLPRVHLTRSDFDRIEVREVRDTTSPEKRVWFVFAVPNEEAKIRLEPIAREFFFDRLLVTVDGKPTDVHSVVSWNYGFPIDAFTSAQVATEYARRFGLPVKQRSS